MPYFMLFNIKYLDIAIFWKPSIVFFVKTLACLKYLRTFAPLLTKSTSEKKFWRGGRVAVYILSAKAYIAVLDKLGYR